MMECISQTGVSSILHAAGDPAYLAGGEALRHRDTLRMQDSDIRNFIVLSSEYRCDLIACIASQ